MKDLQYSILMAMAFLMAMGFTSCDNSKDEPEGDAGQTEKGSINLYDFNGYFLSELTADKKKRFELSYDSVSNNDIHGVAVGIYSFIGTNEFLGQGSLGYGLKISLNTATNSISSLKDSYLDPKAGSDFELNNAGNLSWLTYKTTESFSYNSGSAHSDYQKSYKFYYDDSERLVRIEVEFIKDYSDITHGVSSKTKKIITETYILNWSEGNIKNIDKQRQYTYYDEGELRSEDFTETQYAIAYGEEKNPALQYMYTLSSIFMNDPTLNICPLTGMTGNGPEYLPVNISYTTDDGASGSNDLRFVTGDVNGRNGILEEITEDEKFIYCYDPFGSYRK